MEYAEKENIYDVLYDYCIKNKKADSHFVKKISSIILKSRDLKKYVSKVQCFEDCNTYKAGAYSFFYKKLYYYLPKVNMNTLRYNMLITQVILHECEHIKQYDEIFGGEKTIKNMILKEDLGDQIIDKYLAVADIKNISEPMVKELQKEKAYFDKKSAEYLALYNIAPSERMANIDSALKLLYVMDDTDLKGHEKEINLIEKICCGYLMRGYRIINGVIKCPTYKWFHELEDMAPERKELVTDLKIINAEKKNMPFDERLYMGLPINYEEYQRVLTKKKSL